MTEHWCNNCNRWTRREEPDEYGLALPSCSGCGEHYQCPECGFEIDAHGACLRADSGAGDCPATTPNPTLQGEPV